MAETWNLAGDLPGEIADAIRQALSGDPARVRPVETPAGLMWLKRIEPLSLRWRLQKGDPARRFNLDRNGLHLLHDAGLPVAPIVAEGPDFYVTPDVGPTLRMLLADPHRDMAERARAFRAAGEALGRLHRAGFTHGRPALRDLCWNGQSVTFIDMEQFSARRRGLSDRARDLAVFVHSALADGAAPAEIDAALETYAAIAGPDGLEAARRLGRRYRLLAGPARWIAARKPRARDIAALAPALEYLARIR